MSSKVYCCGWSLKTKTLVIGFFSLFVQLIVSFIILYLDDGKNERPLEVHELNSCNFFILWIEKMQIAIIGLFINSCLIYGAIGEKKWFLMPYITILGSGILFFSVYGVPHILYALLTSQAEVIISHLIFLALFLPLILIILVYSWMTVCSYFVELVESKLYRDVVNHYLG